MPVAGRLGIELLSGAAAAFRLLDLLIPGENIFYFSVRRGKEVKKEGFRVFLCDFKSQKGDSPKTVLGKRGGEEISCFKSI